MMFCLCRDSLCLQHVTILLLFIDLLGTYFLSLGFEIWNSAYVVGCMGAPGHFRRGCTHNTGLSAVGSLYSLSAVSRIFCFVFICSNDVVPAAALLSKRQGCMFVENRKINKLLRLIPSRLCSSPLSFTLQRHSRQAENREYLK